MKKSGTNFSLREMTYEEMVESVKKAEDVLAAKVREGIETLRKNDQLKENGYGTSDN